MRTIGIRKFRAGLTEYLKLVAAGTETYAITCRGQTLAMVVGVESGGKDYPSSSKATDTQGQTKPMDAYALRSDVRSQELRRLAKERYSNLEKLDRRSLVAEFAKVTSITPEDRLSDRQLRIALARVYQLSLWTKQMGFVPEDLASRDLQFWLQMLQSLCGAAPDGAGVKDADDGPEAGT